MDEHSEVPEPEAGFSWSRSRLAVFGSLAAISLGSVVGVALAIANRRTAPLPPLASGWTRHSVRSQGFSVDLPPGWKAVSTTSPEDAYNELKDENPTLGTLVRSQTGVVSSNLIKLLAFDVNAPSISRSFATNMTVVIVSLSEGVEFDAFVNDNVSQLRTTPGVGSTIQSQRLQLPAGEAALIHAHLTTGAPGGEQVSTISQYLLMRGSKGYIISFTTLPFDLPNYALLFDATARTFRFV